MYTLQSLWTQAREGLDVTTRDLQQPLATPSSTWSSTGSAPTAGGPRAKAMLDLSGPDLDFVALATAMGVPATRATTAEELTDQLAAGLDTPGPSVIDCALP